MRFTKMHGVGNDYVYVNCFEETVPDPSALAGAVSDRHFGVGADGLILILPSDNADLRMRVFNSDGSEAEMCGNGIRCVAKYAFDHGLVRTNPMQVETAGGIKRIDMTVGADGKVSSATVDMGQPVFDSARIPVNIPDEEALEVPVRTSKGAFILTCVSMGNPHAVIYVDDVAAVPLEQVGPELETHAMFPERVNVHFVRLQTPREVTIRTWERGSGVTLGCGTGASAVCAGGVVTGRSERTITAHLPGGDLGLEWREDDGHVYMTGPAVEVFSGEWYGVQGGGKGASI